MIADAASKDVALVRSLGADHILDRGDDLADRIREVFPDGVDAVADTALLNEKIVPALRDGGVFVALRRWKGEPVRGIRYEATWVYDTTTRRRSWTRYVKPSKKEPHTPGIRGDAR